MITLPSQVTINSIVVNGVTQPSFTLGPEIDYSVSYSNSAKYANAIIAGFGPINLWRGNDYDAAGNFTDADTDARLLEVIGSDASTFFNEIQKKREMRQPAANKSTPIPPRPSSLVNN